MPIRVKVCGITSAANAVAVARLGVDALGLNFYAKSPRSISEDTAEEILAELPPFVEPIGLFVNTPMQEMLDVAHRLGLRTIQMHGDDLPLPMPGPIRFLPAFAIRDEASLRTVRDYLRRCDEAGVPPAAILLDAHATGLFGGTGRTAPWHLLRDLDLKVPIILAGGLHPGNVAEAIRAVRPYAVDVASGVEASPGVKDLDKVAKFVAEVRRADTELRDLAHGRT